MNERAKITASHLSRQAFVYLRQSSAAQVENNRESTDRQYALAAKARELGWAADRIVVIDEDLGLSGSGFVARSGFARLTAEVALAQPLRSCAAGAWLMILAAQTAGSAHGTWRISNSPALAIALSNDDFRRTLRLASLAGARRIIDRTAVYGPVRTVVWEGRSREAPPIPIFLRVCLATRVDDFTA